MENELSCVKNSFYLSLDSLAPLGVCQRTGSVYSALFMLPYYTTSILSLTDECMLLSALCKALDLKDLRTTYSNHSSVH